MELLRSTLPDKCENYGDYSEPVSDTHKLIASVHLSQGNLEKSLRAYKKVSELTFTKNFDRKYCLVTVKFISNKPPLWCNG